MLCKNCGAEEKLGNKKLTLAGRTFLDRHRRCKKGKRDALKYG